jgi:hypothetical protein
MSRAKMVIVPNPTAGSRPVVHWTEGGETRTARWLSEGGAPPATRVIVADDHTRADDAYGLACQGTALLWLGDFQNARQMLRALANRADRQLRSPEKSAVPSTDMPRGAAFHHHRRAQSQRARTLGALLVPLEEDYGIPLRRAPDVRLACTQAWGRGEGAAVVSLRALLGVIGACEWRIKGIEIAAIGGRIHPHYGVFAPIRSEYVDLVATTPLPASSSSTSLAFDIGTGTGVLAALLVRRGLAHVIATDSDSRAVVCARENLERLGLAQHVEVVQEDLFPARRAALVVCNPPWIPARPSSPIERGIYDPESRMLHRFLSGLPAHLEPGGEGWLILSDLAEHLGLRTRLELFAAIDASGLQVVGRYDMRSKHPRTFDATDPLHAARAAEVTSLWRLSAR